MVERVLSAWALAALLATVVVAADESAATDDLDREAAISIEPVACTVVDPDEVVVPDRGVRQSIDLLPGVDLGGTGPRGLATPVYLRGGNANHTLLVIDGIPINGPLSGESELADLLFDGLDRLDLRRGVLGGPVGIGGLAGTIIGETSRGDGPATVRALLLGGTRVSTRAGADVAGSEGALRYHFYVAHAKTDDTHRNARSRLDLGGVRFDWTMGEVALAVAARGGMNEAGDPGRDLVAVDLNDTTERAGGLFSVRVGHLVGDAVRCDWTFGYVELREEFDGPRPNAAGLTQVNTATAHLDARRHYAAWRGTWEASQENCLTVGAEWRQDAARNDTNDLQWIYSQPGVFSYEDTETNLAVYVEDEAEFAEALVVSAAMRLDEHSASGSGIGSRLAAAYAFEPTGTVARASWGTAVNAPGLAALADPNTGDDDLGEEMVRSWEAGLEQGLLDGKIVLSGTYFENEFSDLLEMDPGTGLMANVGDAEAYGTEWAATVCPLDGLELRAAYTNLDARDLATDRDLPRRANDFGRLDVLWSQDRLSLGTSVKVSGQLRDGDALLDGFTTIDARAEYRITDRISATITGTNILNEEYEEAAGYAASGSLVMGGLTAEF